MTTTVQKALAFGLSDAVPPDVRAVWGARLIAPNDLLWDRQELQADDAAAKAELIKWLNPPDGAIGRITGWLADHYRELPQDSTVKTITDDEGIISLSTNGSYGYVYITAYLLHHAAEGG